MVITVDLSSDPGVVGIEDADDCGRFHVEARGGRAEDWSALGHALVDAGAGRVEGDHAFVEIGAVRTLAGGRVGAEWADAFEKMLAYARSKGWLDETEASIQAHVEWT